MDFFKRKIQKWIKRNSILSVLARQSNSFSVTCFGWKNKYKSCILKNSNNNKKNNWSSVKVSGQGCAETFPSWTKQCQVFSVVQHQAWKHKNSHLTLHCASENFQLLVFYRKHIPLHVPERLLFKLCFRRGWITLRNRSQRYSLFCLWIEHTHCDCLSYAPCFFVFKLRSLLFIYGTNNAML